MRDEEKRCGTCKYHMHEGIDSGYVCVNDQSDHVTDWTEDDDGCERWEAKD